MVVWAGNNLPFSLDQLLGLEKTLEVSHLEDAGYEKDGHLQETREGFGF
jgi:hypothetical protein